MKKLVFLFIISSVTWTIGKSQDDAAMMKAWENWMTPGDMHKWMANTSGDWSGEVNTYWDPDKPEKSKVTVKYTMIFNNLYQVHEYKGIMMGMPFEGRGLLAYDNAKKEFINTWIDNMGSGVIVMTGQYDATTNTLNLKGKQTDPTSGKDTDIRETVQFTGDDKQVITMYGPGLDGKEMKMMDIVLTRGAMISK